jgi:hypothetical protein
MIRHPDWFDRLQTYLDTVAEKPFLWGEHDCALFAASAVQRMTGVDPAEAFRNLYDSELGARKALREVGQGTLLKTAKHWFGAPKSVYFAKRGDLVMRDRTTLGICVGPFSWFVGEEHGAAGLVVIPTNACRYAFTVPFEALASEADTDV